MRFTIAFYILYVFFENCVEVVKSDKSHTTVRSAPLKNVLVEGAGIGAVLRFYSFYKFFIGILPLRGSFEVATFVKRRTHEHCWCSGEKPAQ